jgi:hypothetical protein
LLNASLGVGEIDRYIVNPRQRHFREEESVLLEIQMKSEAAGGERFPKAPAIPAHDYRIEEELSLAAELAYRWILLEIGILQQVRGELATVGYAANAIG